MMFTPNTNDKQLDEAYKKLQGMAKSFKEYPAFEKHFLKEANTNNMPRLNKWLLKILFVQFRYPVENQHKWDKLLESYDAANQEHLAKWLDNELEKRGVK